MSSNKPVIWALMTLLLEALLIAVLVPSSFLDRINNIENGWMESTYSDDSLRWLHEKTDAVHYTLTRETGLADWMSWMFFPPETARAKQGGMSRLGDRLWFPYLESRGKALDDMLRTFLMRLGSVMLWIPLIVLIAIPAFFDGLMERKIKQYTFKYPSPFIYRYGLHAFIGISLLLSICLFSPLPIPPVLLPFGIMTAVAVMGLVVVGNMPKRL